jgi:hypothetical protein
MKSIKEKSEEHAPYTREDSWNKTQRCIIAQTSFEAGANYVLECIEEATNICFDEELRKVIEQLKK